MKALVRRSAELVAITLMYDTRGLLPRLRKPRVIRTRNPIAQHQRRLHMRIESPLYARFEAHFEARGSQERHSHTPPIASHLQHSLPDITVQSIALRTRLGQSLVLIGSSTR
jgi:hypothetical protein